MQVRSVSLRDSDMSRTKKRCHLGNDLAVLRPSLCPLCSDSESVCSAWAKAGECTKNPDFMFDTCKRSCLDEGLQEACPGVTRALCAPCTPAYLTTHSWHIPHIPDSGEVHCAQATQMLRSGRLMHACMQPCMAQPSLPCCLYVISDAYALHPGCR